MEEIVEAIVDCGAVYTWIPSPVLERLGVKPKGMRKLKIADGSIIERNMGVIQIRLREQTGPTWVIFGDCGSEPLLGAITLEEFELGIDPVNKTLIPVISLAV